MVGGRHYNSGLTGIPGRAGAWQGGSSLLVKCRGCCRCRSGSYLSSSSAPRRWGLCGTFASWFSQRPLGTWGVRAGGRCGPSVRSSALCPALRALASGLPLSAADVTSCLPTVSASWEGGVSLWRFLSRRSIAQSWARGDISHAAWGPSGSARLRGWPCEGIPRDGTLGAELAIWVCL